MANPLDQHNLDELIELGKFPLRFATPIFFGKPENGRPNNGTLTLFESTNGIIGITCSHVIQEYLKIDDGGQTIFQIGDVVLNPQEHLIAENERLDLATLNLSQFSLHMFRGKRYPEIGSLCVRDIYQGDVAVGDTVILGGFPGDWTEHSPQSVTTFQTFSAAPAKIVSVSPYQFSCQFDDPNSWPWYQEVQGRGKDLKHPGGLSGGPVFIIRISNGGIRHFELVGIIFQGNFIHNSLIINAHPAKLINSDGTINDDFSSYLYPSSENTDELHSPYEGQAI